jgi:hypothetical protein
MSGAFGANKTAKICYFIGYISQENAGMKNQEEAK